MIKAITHLFFPKVCLACGKAMSLHSEHVCLSCRHELPRVNHQNYVDNELQKTFWGRLPLERATAFLWFQKQGKVQRILHHLKYKGAQDLGVTMGEIMASELIDKGFFEGIDFLIPIPIHAKKARIRGYNQSEMLAMGVNQLTEIEVCTEAIVKEIHTASQTKKSRFKRWKNVNATFKLKHSNQLEGKHILLIDDVLTTGSTVEACGIELLQVPNIKLSLLTLAFAK